jgi:hypothetical protein
MLGARDFVSLNIFSWKEFTIIMKTPFARTSVSFEHFVEWSRFLILSLREQ